MTAKMDDLEVEFPAPTLETLYGVRQRRDEIAATGGITPSEDGLSASFDVKTLLRMICEKHPPIGGRRVLELCVGGKNLALASKL